MKAVAGTKYLYHRRSGYYVRMRVPKRLGIKEIRCSLRCKSLGSAIIRLQSIKTSIQMIKRLVVDSISLDTVTIKQRLIVIKDNMKKQLSMADIESLITKLEQTYSNSAHAVNALGEKPFNEMSDETIGLLGFVLDADSPEERDLRLVAVANKLKDENLMGFAVGLSATLKLADSLDDGIAPRDYNTMSLAKVLLSKNGYDANEQSLEFKVLMSKLKSSTELQREIFSSIVQGDAIGERQLSSLIPQQTTAGGEQVQTVPSETGPLFSEVYAEFLNHKIKKEKLTEKMQKYYKQYLAVWSLIAEDKPIEQYTAKDIGKFVDRCFELPKMNISPYNKMSWQERVEADVPDEDIASPKTAHQYYKWLQGVFAYAKRDTVGYIQNSPCTIKRDFKSKTRGIYSATELRSLVEAANKPNKIWHRWAVLLAIYTGARRGEIAQLRKGDIKFDESTKRHYVLVTDQGPDQKLKTENARRMIPLHKALLEAGFIEYVESKADKLFDELYSREAITNWFSRHVNNLNIPTENELGHKRSFHSFRHTFITTLMNKGLAVNLIQQVVGHEIKSFGITDNYSHKSTDIKPLLAIVDAFDI